MTNLTLINNLDPNIIRYNDNYYLVISNLLGYQNNPAYGLFILIDDKIFEDDNDIQIFIHSLQGETIDGISNILATGIEDKFEIGVNYFLSFSLWQYLMQYDNDSKINLLPNDVNDYRMQDYFDSQYNRINNDIYVDISDTDLHYYYMLNKLNEFELSIDELKNFVKTFCTIILENTQFTDITDTKNLIYKHVLEYWSNNGNDDTSIMLNLIFNNTMFIDDGVASTCCTNLQNNTKLNEASVISTLGSNSISNISCKEIYDKSMLMYLVKMLGDYMFYCDWFTIDFNDISTPNLVLIKKLKELFEKFKELGYYLYWGKNNEKCGCNSRKSLSNDMIQQSNANYIIFDNYYKVLQYNEDDVVCENKNKIKAYGEAFGEILPYIYYI